MVASHTTDIDFGQYRFAPAIALPDDFEVYDFTQGYDPDRPRRSPFGIGRYAERRVGMYQTPQFGPGTAEPRFIHLGIDIAAPVDTPVQAFFDGVVYLAGINAAPGDYGGTLITEHRLGEHSLWALHGHLSHASIAGKTPGQPLRRGEVIAHVGDRSENGGWNPHLHFQLSWVRPDRCDMPGTASERGLAEALAVYPDPRLVLGPLY